MSNWTGEDVRFLRLYWGYMPTINIAIRLNKSKHEVVAKAQEIGILKRTKRKALSFIPLIEDAGIETGDYLRIKYRAWKRGLEIKTGVVEDIKPTYIRIRHRLYLECYQLCDLLTGRLELTVLRKGGAKHADKIPA